jgi:hypothetical protein
MPPFVTQANAPCVRPRDKVVQLPAVKQAPLQECEEDEEEALMLDEGPPEQVRSMCCIHMQAAPASSVTDDQ